MENKFVHNCRFVHHAKFHCDMTMLNKLFKIEFERGGQEKSRNLSEEKKTHPEHKYSVTFVSKVGTTRLLVSGQSPKFSDCLMRSMEQL